MKKETEIKIQMKQSHFEKLFIEGKYHSLMEELQGYLKEDPDHVDCLLKVAVVYREMGNYSLSESAYVKIIELMPNHPYAYSVYGELLFHVGYLDKAIKQHDKALSLEKNYHHALYGKGHAFLKKLNYKEAVDCFKLALKSQPDSEQLITSIAGCYTKLKLHKEASEAYKSIALKKYKNYIENTNYYLESLLLSGNKSSFYNALNETISNNILSPKTASISSHASVRYEEEDKYSFCSQPLNHIYKRNLIDDNILNKKDINSVIELSNIGFIATRRQDLLEGGKQTTGNFFEEDKVSTNGIIQNFLEIINNEILKYKAFFPNECELIKSFPKYYDVRGWLIQIESAGFLKPHIHKTGWLSGSIYLELPQNRVQEEGNIKFSTEGMDYPTDGKLFPQKIIDLNLGDIVLFPSSLFHSTIPFNSKQKRITLAFDIIPKNQQ